MSQKNPSTLSELLLESRKGNNASYNVFLTETAQLVRKYLRSRMNSETIIDDIVQETLIAIHQGRHSYLEGRAIEPWIYAICRNRMIDHFRKANRISLNEVLVAEFIDQQDDSPTADDASTAATDQLNEALGRLPEKQRKIVEYLKIEDLSIKEVAALTGMTEGSIKVAAHRAYEKIRQLIGGDPK